MADKYISISAGGVLTEVAATVSSSGAANAGDIPALDGDGRLDDSLMPSGVSAEVVVCVASEALAENDVVNFWDDTGTLKCRKADASDATKPAHGYVKAGVAEAGNATVYTDGFLPGTALTKGSKYFLSETAGLVTTTAPTTGGAIVQCIGVSVSATEIKFDPDRMFVIRA